jgi:hypothetical protein
MRCVGLWQNGRMRRRELSERLEGSLERGETEMRLSRAAFDRNGQAFERMTAAFDRFEQAFESNQVFMRDMHRRNEIVTQQVIRDHQEFMQRLMAGDERADRKSDQILAELKEGREESRAQRQALLALIDRLPPQAA